MSACENQIEKILLSIDGELDDIQEKELQEHLAVCDGCRSLYLTYQNIQKGINDMNEEAPEGLTRSVMSAIRQEKEKSTPVYFLKRARFTLIAAAACLVLVFAGRNLDFSADTTSAETAAATGAVAEAAFEAQMPMTETALIPAYDPETEAAAVAEEEMETAAETFTIAPRIGEETADEEVDADFSVGGDLDEIRLLLEMLEQAGYTGDLVQLKDTTEEAVYERFPACEKVELSDGTTVYRVPWAAFDAVADQMNYGHVFSTSVAGEYAFLWLD